MSPVIFEIFGFEIRWYSVLILTGIIVAYSLAYMESKKFQIKKEFLFNLLFWTLIIGIVGARLYYVVFNFDYYKDNLIEIVQVWNGGLAIHGGILFGLITIIFYTRKYKANTWKILDILAPSVVIAQAIGRWGNFFNSEAYGSVVEYKTLVNMKIIPQFVIDNMYINGAYHLPMFYFESISCLIVFIILLINRRRKYVKNGEILSLYLILYGIIRFVIETFRTDSLMFMDLKVAQIVSVIMILTGIIIIIKKHRKPKLDDLYNKIDESMIF